MNITKRDQTDRAVKCPTKRTVNLAKKESHKQSLVTLIVGIAIIAVLCFMVAKFGVADQFERLSAAESAYNDVHSQYIEMQEALASYDDVEQEYHTYSRKWMTSGENIAVTVDRAEVLDLLEDKLMSCGTVNSFLVEDDTVLANMSGMNLEEISVMFEDLQRQPIVDSAKLTIASTASDTGEVLDFSITIVLQAEDEEEDAK